MESPQRPSNKRRKSSRTSGRLLITHPDRVIYKATNTKKRDVANYYKSVAPWMLPYLENRPLALLRCQENAGSSCFFQKHLDATDLSEVRTSEAEGQNVIYVDSEEGLLQLVQQGAVEFHTWQTRLEYPSKGDQIIFDIDPDENLPWDLTVQTATLFRDILKGLKLKSFVKTTGGKGLHVHVPVAPVYSREELKGFSKSVCKYLEKEYPELYTASSAKKGRQKRIFLDYLRNGRGATAIAPYALRAKDKPAVSVPVSWNELKTLEGPQHYDLDSTLRRLARLKKDPWAEVLSIKQRISLLDENRRKPAKASSTASTMQL